MVAHCLDYLKRRELDFALESSLRKRLQGPGGEIDRDGLVRDAREGQDAVDGAFQVAEARADAQGDVVQDLVRQRHSLAAGLGQQEVVAVFYRGLFDLGDEAPVELRRETCAGARRDRVLVAGQDDPAAEVVQGGDGLEKLGLGRLLADQRLNVVDKEDIQVAVTGAEGRAGLVADGAGEFAQELLGVDKQDPLALAAGLPAMACRRWVLPLPCAPVRKSGE